MKRILFIVPLPPPIHGHSMMCKYVLENHYVSNEFDFDVVNLHTSRSMEEMGKRPLLKVFRFMLAFFRTFFLLVFHRYTFCYIAITCHGSGFLKDMPFALLCKLFRQRIVYHQHNQGVRYDMDRSPYKWLYPLVYNNSIVILLSWNLYSDISRYVSKDRVLICPNGIPPVDMNGISKVNNDVKHILFLSNLLVEKGVYVLLEALSLLKEDGISFICDIVGSETGEIDRRKLEENVRSKGIEDNVVYHGAKYGKEKNQFLSSADIFVLPTLNECFPLVLLEAMQHSLVCVASKEGAIPDIIKDGKTGYIFEKGNASELYERLKALINNPHDLIKMGDEGHKFYISNLTIDIFERRIFTLFTQISKMD